MRARMNRGRGKRDAKQQERAAELLAKEEQRQQAFMAQLGVDLTKGKVGFRDSATTFR